MITGDTSFAAVWWWMGPLLADWWPGLTVGSVIGLLAVVALVNLAVSQSAPDGDEPAECAETVELPRPRSGMRTGTIHAPCQRVPSDAPTQFIERVGGR